MLGLQTQEHHISAARLVETTIDDPRTETAIPFAAWAGKLVELDAAQQPLSPLEKQGLRLVDRYWTYQSLRMGRTLEVLPLRGSATQDWIPIGAVLMTDWDDASDPSGGVRKAQQFLQQAHAAYHAHDADAMRLAVSQLLPALRAAAEELGSYPSSTIIEVEVEYHRWAPFRIAWMLMSAALICFWLYSASGWKSFGWIRGARLYRTLGALVGFAFRIAITGRPPVTNMYESLVYVGTGVAL